MQICQHPSCNQMSARVKRYHISLKSVHMYRPALHARLFIQHLVHQFDHRHTRCLVLEVQATPTAAWVDAAGWQVGVPYMLDFAVAHLGLHKGLQGSLPPAAGGELGMCPLGGPYPVAL